MMAGYCILARGSSEMFVWFCIAVNCFAGTADLFAGMAEICIMPQHADIFHLMLHCGGLVLMHAIAQHM